MKNVLITCLTMLTLSCNGQEKKVETGTTENPVAQHSNSQIAEYVVETFQDSKGNLWFGTLENGVAKYDGAKLIYLTTLDGLPSDRIVAIVEDHAGSLWFGTGAGLSKLDGKAFVNYSERDGLCSDRISNVFIDSKGVFWIGTWDGVCRFNGTQFENVSVPNPTIETMINPDTKEWITGFMEDANGHIWIGRDGFGACKFDGNSFEHFTTKEGLNSNNVQAILEDKEGHIWIGTRVAEKDDPDASRRFGKGGLNKYDGERFTHFPKIKGLSENDVYGLYKDKANHLWIGTTSNGVYKFTGNEFVHFDVPKSTMCFLNDRQGNMWLGCAGGLYRISPNGEIVNVTTNGPWH